MVRLENEEMNIEISGIRQPRWSNHKEGETV